MFKRYAQAFIILGTAYLASGLPNFFSFELSGVTNNQVAFIIACILATVFWRGELKELARDRWNWLPLLLIVIFGFLSGRYVQIGSSGENEMIYLFFMLVKPALLFLLFMIVCRGSGDFARTLMVSYGFILLSLVIFYMELADSGVNVLDLAGRRVNADRYDILLNNNTVSYMAIILPLISMRMSEIAREGSRVFWGSLHWLSLGVAAWVCAFNQSRGALIYLGLIGLVSAFAIVRRNQFSRNFAVVSVLVLMVIAASFVIDYEDISQSEMVSRLQHPEESSDNIRTVLMHASIDYFLASPLIGNDTVARVPGIKSQDHNHFTLVMSRYGLVGLVLLCLYLCSIARGTRWSSTSSQKLSLLFIFFYLLFAPPYPFLAIPFLLVRWQPRN